ncbi:hypothetical protein WJT86_00125 [Microvirga sp. W0021]|uniref:Uncharacterized protein n=1 Tax=Hohaiivirga grylli TaxID=3133970 RepID=A0ABV0BGR2_9HYPH
MEFLVQCDPKFPYNDIVDIRQRLLKSNALVFGYAFEKFDLFSIESILHLQHFEEKKIQLLPDLNIVSRMINVAQFGIPSRMDDVTKLAIDLMAFSQTMNIFIEPSIAFHELASCEGNQKALEKLAWFRVADYGQANSWVDLAQGRIQRLPSVSLKETQKLDLAYPLSRWRRNYIVALKIAELELSNLTQLDRALSLLKWMVQDYFFAGPAAIFATMYFSPHKKKRVIKNLHSTDRERAIRGIKNAAWDITHMSDFVAKINKNDQNIKQGEYFIFATADKSLAEIAPVLIYNSSKYDQVDELARNLSKWWPSVEALKISEVLTQYLRDIEGRPPPTSTLPSDNPIQFMIEKGERIIKGTVK